MQHFQTSARRGEFDLITKTRLGQAAKMTLRPGGTSDEELSNEHPHSEQWLFVITGTGEAHVKPKAGRLRRIKLAAGSLLVIEKGERHQIVNTGRKHLVTVNFYLPPAYGADSEPIERE